MGERGDVWGQRWDFMVDVLNHNAVECPVYVTPSDWPGLRDVNVDHLCIAVAVA